MKKAEYLLASRAKVTEGRIRAWFDHVASLLEEEGVKDVLNDPSRIFNCDETAVWLNPNGKRVLTKKAETAMVKKTRKAKNDDPFASKRTVSSAKVLAPIKKASTSSIPELLL